MDKTFEIQAGDIIKTPIGQYVAVQHTAYTYVLQSMFLFTDILASQQQTFDPNRPPYEKCNREWVYWLDSYFWNSWELWRDAGYLTYTPVIRHRWERG